MTRMYIDDIRTPKSSKFNIIVRSSHDAIEFMMKHGCPSYISFDHDLGVYDTSMNIVHFMIKRDLDNNGFIPEDFTFNVHSANPVGAKNITETLQSYLKFRLT